MGRRNMNCRAALGVAKPGAQSNPRGRPERREELRMKVIDIVKKYLEENGYGGLISNGDCVCSLKYLMPCGHVKPDCEALNRVPCEGGESDGGN
jgi:hypothetical protein